MISEYHGASIFAQLLANSDERIRWRQRIQRKEEQRQIARWLEINRRVDQTLDLCDCVVNIYMLLSGFHTHHGTWRQCREKKITER